MEFLAGFAVGIAFVGWFCLAVGKLEAWHRSRE